MSAGPSHMKIAIVSTMSPFPWGGSEFLWAEMADEALRAGCDVELFVYQWPSTAARILELQRKGARVFYRRRPEQDGHGRIQRVARRVARRVTRQFARQLASPFRRLSEFDPDVVCISQGSMFDVVWPGFPDLIEILRARSIPYIVVCQHNAEAAIHTAHVRQMVGAFFAQAHRVAFVAQGNARSAERHLAQSLPNAIVLRNPVNLSDVTIVDWPSPGPLRMACVARLQAMFKGQDVLLEAFSSEAWRRRDWRLRLYGAGPDREYLETLAHHYGISSRVEFAGHVDDIREVWAGNHLLVLPSRGEGTPLALVEAMLCGRPSVVTDVGGNAEWVDEGRTGFIADAPTATSFGAALERAWTARARLMDMGLQAHDSALEKYDRAPGKSLLRVVLDAAHTRTATRGEEEGGLALAPTQRSAGSSPSFAPTTTNPQPVEQRAPQTLETTSMSESTCRISAVIVTLNRADYLRLSLKSLVDQTLPTEHYEIIVVDNGSTDDTRRVVCEEYADTPNLRYISEPVPGANRARNRGWRAAHGAYVAYLDDDAIAYPQWLEKIVDAFENTEPRPGCVGGRIEPIWERPRPGWLSDGLIGYVSAFDLYKVPTVLADPHRLISANIAFRRYLLETVREFDESLGRRGTKLLSMDEDSVQTDLMAKGFACLYHPDIAVRHHVHAARLTQGWLIRRAYWQGISQAIAQLNQQPLSTPRRYRMALARVWPLLKPRPLVRLILPTNSPRRFTVKCEDWRMIGIAAGLLGIVDVR